MNPFPPRRLLLTAAVAWPVLMLGGCALLQPGPRTIEISEVKLVELIST
jgi:hypothetical protein